jgi:hypothetical protein
MALQTSLRPADQSRTEGAFWSERSRSEPSWLEPPRAAAVGIPEVPRVAGVFSEAEWVGGPGLAAPASSPARGPALSSGLARLLNAAAIDSTFGALFLKSPMEAARQATNPAGDLFGAGLPDATLRLTLPELTGPEWAMLRQLPTTESLAAAARALRSLAQGATIFAVQAVPLNAPASQEGALAGAA